MTPAAFLAFLTTVHDLRASLSPNGIGHERCECIAESDTIFDKYMKELPKGYGRGCAPHDSVYKVYDACHNGTAPDWCYDEWCYVNYKACGVAKEVSELVSTVGYSYETCGFLNEFNTRLLAGSLGNETLSIVDLTDPGGWKGSYCTGVGDCFGVTSEFIKKTIQTSQAIPQYVGTLVDAGKFEGLFPEPVLRQVAEHIPVNDSNLFDVCVYATGMGFVDICIGALTVTPERQTVSPFIPLYSEPAFLITEKVSQKTWKTYLYTAFKPFSPELWLALIASFSLTAVLMVWHERYPEGAFEGRQLSKALVLSSYNSLQSFLSGGNTYEVTNPGSKATTLAHGFLVLITITTYTANLASLLSSLPTDMAVSSVNQVITEEHKVCVEETLLPYVIDNTKLPEDLLILKGNVEDVFDAVPNECTAAIVKYEDFQAARGFSVMTKQRGRRLKSGGGGGGSPVKKGGSDGEEDTSGKPICNKVRVGDPLFHLVKGFPVSAKIHRALLLAATKELHKGRWQQLESLYEPMDTCKNTNSIVSNEEGMSLEYMLGPFIIVLFFNLLGLVLKPLYRGSLHVITHGDRMAREHTKRMLDVVDKHAALHDAVAELHKIISASAAGTSAQASKDTIEASSMSTFKNQAEHEPTHSHSCGGVKESHSHRKHSPAQTPENSERAPSKGVTFANDDTKMESVTEPKPIVPL